MKKITIWLVVVALAASMALFGLACKATATTVAETTAAETTIAETSAADAAAIIPSLKKAKEAGFIVWCSNAQPGPEGYKYVYGFSGANCMLQAETLASQVIIPDFQALGFSKDKPANMVMIMGTPGSTAVNERDMGYENKILESGIINLLAKQPGNWVKEDSMKAMQNLLVAYGDQIDGVYAHDDTMAVGAWLALEAAGYKPGDMIIYGIGGSKEGLAAIKDGIIKTTILQSPVQDGTMPIEALKKIFAGEEVKFLQWIDPVIITKDNVDQYLPGEW